MVEVAKAQDAPDWADETIRYSASSECPVPATLLILVAVDPAIAPTVSVTEVYPPNIEKTKSLPLLVEIPDTVGAAVVAVQVDRELFGILAFGSKGEPVFAPVTANSSPEAALGVPLRLIVITSVVIVVDAMPYHSVWVVS